MELRQLIELLREGVGLTDEVCVRLNDKQVPIHRVYIEDYCDELLQVVIEIKESSNENNS